MRRPVTRAPRVFVAIGCTVFFIQVASVSARLQLSSALAVKATAPSSSPLTVTGAGMVQAPSTTGGSGVASTPRSAMTAPQVERAAGGGSLSGRERLTCRAWRHGAQGERRRREAGCGRIAEHGFARVAAVARPQPGHGDRQQVGGGRASKARRRPVSGSFPAGLLTGLRGRLVVRLLVRLVGRRLVGAAFPAAVASAGSSVAVFSGSGSAVLWLGLLRAGGRGFSAFFMVRAGGPSSRSKNCTGFSARAGPAAARRQNGQQCRQCASQRFALHSCAAAAPCERAKQQNAAFFKPYRAAPAGGKRIAVERQSLVVEAAEDDPLELSRLILDEIGDGLDGDDRGAVGGKAVDAGRDRREGDRGRAPCSRAISSERV